MSNIVKYSFLLILVFLLVSYYTGTTSVVNTLSSGVNSFVKALQGSGKYAE